MAISAIGISGEGSVGTTNQLFTDAIPQMRWYLRYIAGGTFLAGVGTDWTAQFEGKDYFPYFTFGGEIELGATAEGYTIKTGIYCPNDGAQLSLYIAFTGFQIQINCNGAITAPASDTITTLSLFQGSNVVQLTVPSGSLIVRGSLPAKNASCFFVPPFPPGQDPAMQ